MFTVLLKIIALILKMVDRHYEGIDAEEVRSGKIKKALAEGDNDTASILLAHQLRMAKKRRNNSKG